ncbi:MAG: helicase [Candidatus Brocadiaceae bacterium]|nr:helicase [Candidatus Brocadiaceae bacterium]
MDIPVTTNADVVSEYLKVEENTTSVLFSTYQSSKVLSEASLKANVHFDVAIFDEAHRTAGAHNSIWVIALDDKKVPIKKRLFMTATPRIYAPHITKKAEEEDVLLCSMDDQAVYGAPIYKMSFGQAIERDLITPYKVVVICVTDAEVSELINKGKTILTAENQPWDARALAKRIALVKAMKSYGFKKMFTFHSRVSGAAAFTKNDSPYSFQRIVNLLDISTPENVDITCFHVNGEMSSGERNARLDEFKKAHIAVMSNARCLTEGVDVPLVDAIAFIDPKKSIIDIVQATGRAMRKAKGKEKGYIFVPVFVGAETDPERYLDSSDFKTVWQVLQAMVDNDQHIQDIVSRLRTLQGMGEAGSKAWNTAMAEYREKVEFFNLPEKVDQARFVEALTTRIIEVIARQWDFWFGIMIKYKNQHGTANAPSNYKTPEGYSLGSWQDRQRQYYRKGRLISDRIRKLEEIGFKWNVLEDAFEKGFQETVKYKNQFGDPNAPCVYKTAEGYSLGQWQAHQRTLSRKGLLLPNDVKQLEEIGFKWILIEESFEQGFRETLKYKKQFGNANVPTAYKTLEDYPLGGWQHRQRQLFKKHKLALDRVKRLEEVGFVWDLFNDTFEKGFQETLKYKEQFGVANVTNKYITPDEYKLGAWQATQKQLYKQNKLSSVKIKMLEEIEFTWDSFKEAFEKGFRETLNYREQLGNPNAPDNYKTPDGYPLGSWQRRQRQLYKNGKLAAEKVKRFEEIGFTWDTFEEAFEIGFQETLKYKNQFSTPNVPQNYITTKDYELGRWQSRKRLLYKKGKLSIDKVKKLEGIGFIWDPYKEEFERGFQETLRYKKQLGDPNAPAPYETPESYHLGRWQTKRRQDYKNGKLTPDRTKRLEEIGFKWKFMDEILSKSFARGFQETLKYKALFDTSNAPYSYVTQGGFKLGQWQNSIRQKYKENKLSPDKVNRLEEIGFKWAIIENIIHEAWERGFTETLKYKEQFSNSNAPQSYKTPEGYRLGQWQDVQRQLYKKEDLVSGKVEKLEEIGFKWIMLKDAFDQGFMETLKYMKQFGDPNTPTAYRTPEGYGLGIWQHGLRQRYRKGKLATDRVQRLEEIGFKWQKR